MPSELHKMKYGAAGEVELELDGDCLVADCQVAGEPLDDPAAATAAALLSPDGFPPACAACVPGDRVAITVDAGMPQAAAVVSGAIHALRNDHDDLHIDVLCASRDLAERLEQAGVPADVYWHDPQDEQKLSYLAASKEGEPIYFNRLLQEADVVVPIGVLRPAAALAYLGVSGGLFPTFSDSTSQARFRTPGSSREHRQQRQDEAAEAAWLLGIQFTVQVIPGPGDSVLHVIAGDAPRVQESGGRLCDAAWQFAAPRRATLVVAAIDGGADEQTWENFGRALHAARQAAEDDADIVICTDLATAPGPALRQLAGVGSGEELARDLTRRRTADAVSASVLNEALQTSRVYLLSQLRVEQVEDLGLGHVADHDELARLVQRHRSCTLIPSAHRAMVCAAG